MIQHKPNQRCQRNAEAYGNVPVAMTDSMTFSRVALDSRRERWLAVFGCSVTIDAKKLSLVVSIARFSRPVFP